MHASKCRSTGSSHKQSMGCGCVSNVHMLLARTGCFCRYKGWGWTGEQVVLVPVPGSAVKPLPDALGDLVTLESAAAEALGSTHAAWLLPLLEASMVAEASARMGSSTAQGSGMAGGPSLQGSPQGAITGFVAKLASDWVAVSVALVAGVAIALCAMRGGTGASSAAGKEGPVQQQQQQRADAAKGPFGALTDVNAPAAGSNESEGASLPDLMGHGVSGALSSTSASSFTAPLDDPVSCSTLPSGGSSRPCFAANDSLASGSVRSESGAAAAPEAARSGPGFGPERPQVPPVSPESGHQGGTLHSDLLDVPCTDGASGGGLKGTNGELGASPVPSLTGDPAAADSGTTAPDAPGKVPAEAKGDGEAVWQPKQAIDSLAQSLSQDDADKILLVSPIGSGACGVVFKVRDGRRRGGGTNCCVAFRVGSGWLAGWHCGTTCLSHPTITYRCC